MKNTKHRVAILGSRGLVRNMRSKSIESILRECGENTGNLVFQRAASVLVDDEQLFVGPGADLHQDLSRVHAECRAVVFPAANHIDLRNDLLAIANWLSGMSAPVVILGIGTQASDCSPEALRDLSDTFSHDAGFLELMRFFRSPGVFVGVRGSFTKSLLERFDVPAIVTGCPSLLLNANPGLGEIIAERFARVAQKSQLPHQGLRIAVTASSPWASSAEVEAERVLLDLFADHDGIYVQQSGGIDAMTLAAGRASTNSGEIQNWYRDRIAPHVAPIAFERMVNSKLKTFFSVDEWRDAIGGCDLSIGTRYHGNALAMQCGVPAVMVAHDSRTQELCISTGVPFVSTKELRATGPLQLVQRIQFDARQYDELRSSTASIVLHALEQAGISPSEQLVRLAEAG
jgi:hypothetical protein